MFNINVINTIKGSRFKELFFIASSRIFLSEAFFFYCEPLPLVKNLSTTGTFATGFCVRSLRSGHLGQPVRLHPPATCQHSEKSKQPFSVILKVILILFCNGCGMNPQESWFLRTAGLGQQLQRTEPPRVGWLFGVPCSRVGFLQETQLVGPPPLLSPSASHVLKCASRAGHPGCL